ncbi:MAG: Kelch repeat-containing protein, partial [Limisphaerales bacterium]
MSGPVAGVIAPRAPAAPQVVLYDQLNNPGTLSTNSQDFEAANDPFDDFLADDFVVPGGQNWSITEVDAEGVYFNGPGPAASFNVFFYQDSGGLPGAQAYSATGQAYVNNAGVFQITLSPAAVLAPGTYWVSVQARQDFTPAGEWGWTDRTTQANSPAAWQNPGGGFATTCTTWGVRQTCTMSPAGEPDQMFRLIGTISGGCGNLAWQAAANMPQDFYGGATASDGTYGYVAGGYSFSSGLTLSTLYRYDPVANAWATLTPYPGAGFIEGVAVYYPTTNRIYVFGGEDAVSGTNYNNTRIYDIASATWLSDGATMPDVHSFMAGGYIPADGKIYILSGYNTGQVTDAQPNTWRYDPVGNAWTDLTGTAPYPHPAGGFGFGVINNHIYTAGGRDASNTVINLTYDFNPATLTYTPKANEPGTNNNVPGSGVAQSALWVFGGGNPFAGPGSAAAFAKPLAKLAPNVKVNVQVPETTNSTLVYNPAGDNWVTGPAMTSVRSFPGGTNIGNLLLAAGGYN